jgi:hypothetical protein
MAARDDRPADDLTGWIDELRDRLNRGDLAGHPPVDVGYGTGAMPAEQTIRIMLADLDSFDDLTPEDRPSADQEARRRGVLNDFRRLRELIG